MSYTSQYPIQDSYHVKATSLQGSNWRPYYATDPIKSLIGSWTLNSWLSVTYSPTNQRFHIDLGSAKIIRRIYYENIHSMGTGIDAGVKNFTFWGSNESTAFNELTYGTDTNWTQLTISQSTFDQHVGADQEDPKYIIVTNSTAYRYYAFKFADNWGFEYYTGVRRIELQTGPPPSPSGNAIFFGCNF